MATSIAAIVQCVILTVLLRRRMAADGQAVFNGPTVAGLLRIVVAAAVMGGVVGLMLWLWQRPDHFGGRLLRLTATSVLGIGLYGGFAMVWRMKEIRWLLDRQRPAPGNAPSV